jgi:DNA ligase-1
VQEVLGLGHLNGLDGEITVGDPTSPTVFHDTQSAVMSHGGSPDVHYHVFDRTESNAGFMFRLSGVKERIKLIGNPSITVVPHQYVESLKELLDFESEMLTKGWEGIMIRDPDGPYKQGRSTFNEGYLIKIKRFEDSEAEILGCYEQETNTNEATINEVGRSKRSSHKEGKVPNGHLGGFYVRDLTTGVEFDVGTMLGITKEQRRNMWINFCSEPSGYIGQTIKYKFQPIGVKDKPRTPILLGFRSSIDM